jgi:hypothetical protein
VAAGRRALVVATYAYADAGLSRLAAPAHDAESLASVLEDPAIAGFDVTMLVNKPHYEVGEAIADFYGAARRDDLTLLYFTGHGVKDDEGRLYLAMANTRREALMFTAISAAQLNDAMDASRSRRKVLVLDCCYSGAFPAGRAAKDDEGVQTLERFQGRGRAVLTASDATQYAFEGDDLRGTGTSSVFTRHLVEAISSGAADLDEDGDIALDELYSYVYEQVVAEMPQQRPKKQEDVDGRILIARNVHWKLPDYLRHAIESPIAAQRLNALQELEHLHVVGNGVVRSAVAGQLQVLAADDSRSVSSAAAALLGRLDPSSAPAAAVEVPAQRAAPSARTVERPVVRTPVPPVAAPPAVTDEPSIEPAPSSGAPPADGGVPVRTVLALIVVAGVLQLLSRFLVFDASSDSRAEDSGLATAPWVVAVALPLLVAALLLVIGPRVARIAALAAGLVAAAALSQLDQALATAGIRLQSDSGVTPGPGWFAAVGGTLALLACVVVLLRAPWLRSRPGLRHDWPAAVATTIVLVGLALRVVAFRWASPWFTHNEPAIILALACLPLTLLALQPVQRLLGLTAVTIFGAWVCAAHIYAFADDDFPVDAGAAGLAIATALLSVAACYAAGIPSRRAPTVAGEKEPDAAPAVAVPVVPVLVLVLTAGTLLLLSRLVAFDPGNGYHAADLGYPAVPWVLAVVIPLVAVTQLLMLRGTEAWTMALAVGLLGGVTLVQAEQVLSTSALAADQDSDVHVGGPGWWLAVLGTAVLVGCVVLVLRAGVLAGTPHAGAGWRTLLGLALVTGALFASLSAFHDFYLWWPANDSALLMGTIALPVVVLALNGAQRLAVLVGVTVFGVSVALWIVYAIFDETFFSDAGPGLVVAVSALVSVMGCYVAQVRPPRRAPDRPAAGAASRR